MRTGKRRIIRAQVALAFLALSACSTTTSYEFASTDESLPSLPSDLKDPYTPEETGLECRTNVIQGLTSTGGSETVDTALIGASLRSGRSNSDNHSVVFYIAPDRPNGKNDYTPDSKMRLETVSGAVYDYAYTDGKVSKASLTRSGDSEDVADRLTFLVGGSKSQISIPLVRGIVNESDPLKSVSLDIEGQPLGSCQPIEGRNVYPEAVQAKPANTTAPKTTTTGEPTELDRYTSALTEAGVNFQTGRTGTYKTDQNICREMREGEMDGWDLAGLERLLDPNHDNARRIKTMVPILCPDQQELIDRAAAGDVVQTSIFDGNYVVQDLPEPKKRVVQPGTWRTKSSVSDCYYERNDGAGNIIENNFVTYAEQLQVYISPSDGAFVSRSCGDWERVLQ